jgi:hypothetical protein
MHEERIDVDTEVKNIFAYRLAYQVNIDLYNEYAHFYPLANLFDVLELLFDKAEDIIDLLTNASFNISLQESSLGIQTSYIKYIQTDYTRYPSLSDIEIDDDYRTLIKMSATESGVDDDTGLDFSAPFINQRLVNPYWVPEYYKQKDIYNENRYESYNVVDKEMAFINYENLTTLLHEIARGLNCYLTIQTSITGEIRIALIPRNSVVEEDLVYIADMTNAEINTGSVQSSEANEYFGLANIFATDGYDKIYNEPDSYQLLQSDEYKSEAELRKIREEINNIKSKRLLFSTAYTLRRAVYEDWNQTYPFNICHSDSIHNDYALTSRVSERRMMEERLHTALYIKTKPKESDQITRLGAEQDIWRPASKIFVNHDGEDVEFDALDEFINYDARTSVQYYENTYNITVPYWSAFSKNADGSNPHWSNLKIGSKLALNEVIRIFNVSSWIEYLNPSDTIFIVTEISRNPNYPETKIKLLNTSRFAYGVWSGSVSSLTALNYFCDNGRNLEWICDGIKAKRYTIESGEEIEEGDAVMELDNGNIAKAISHHNYMGRIRGIALESGSGDDGDEIVIQLKGRVYVDGWDFSDYINKQLFVRTNAVATNISTELLDDPTDDEDLIIYLGEIDTENSFIIDIHEYKLEEKLWPASH